MQPNPIANDGASMHDLVIARIEERKRIGLAVYKTPLQANNGRDALEDAIDELVDGACYLMQAKVEREIIPTQLRELMGLLTAKKENAVEQQEFAAAAAYRDCRVWLRLILKEPEQPESERP